MREDPLEKLTVPQLIKKFITLYGTPTFITGLPPVLYDAKRRNGFGLNWLHKTDVNSRLSFATHQCYLSFIWATFIKCICSNRAEIQTWYLQSHAGWLILHSSCQCWIIMMYVTDQKRKAFHYLLLQNVLTTVTWILDRCDQFNLVWKQLVWNLQGYLQEPQATHYIYQIHK